MATNTQPIIIKKKGGHGGHHGGAWKVAYADFVTAMMALFIVLWLMNTSKPIQEAISGYFKDPAGTGKFTGISKPPIQVASKDDLEKVKTQLEKAIQQVANFDKLKSQIELTVTTEGLRIELLESKTGTFFESGQVEPNANGRELLMTIAEEVGKIPNKVFVEGHTDSATFCWCGELYELGALRRPRQRQPPHHATARPARRSGGAGARLRRSAAAKRKGSSRLGQPKNYDDRALYGPGRPIAGRCCFAAEPAANSGRGIDSRVDCGG